MTVVAPELTSAAAGVEGCPQHRTDTGPRQRLQAGPCPNLDMQGRSCKRRDCPACGFRWARRWSRVFLLNLEHYAGDVAMITITAPGVEGGLPWDRGACLIRRPHRCTGPAGCVVEEFAGDEWSSDQTLRWKMLREAARAAVKRRLDIAPSLIGRVWEPQKRGVAHLHIAVGCKTEEELEAALAFRDELERLAPEYRFGFVSQKVDPHAPKHAARYVAEYLTGRQANARERKATIRENVSNPRMPRSLLWITPALTTVSDSARLAGMRARLGVRNGTAVTMRTLRYVGWYWGAREGSCNVLPRLFGDAMVKVARAITHIEQHNWRGPPEDGPEERFQHHCRVLRTMRRIQPAYTWSPA